MFNTFYLYRTDVIDNTFIFSDFCYHCSQWPKWPLTLERIDTAVSNGSRLITAQCSFRLATRSDIVSSVSTYYQRQ